MAPRTTIEDLRALAEQRGGKCLSSEYLGKSAKLRWRCAQGHEWEASAANESGYNQSCKNTESKEMNANRTQDKTTNPPCPKCGGGIVFPPRAGMSINDCKCSKCGEAFSFSALLRKGFHPGNGGVD